MKKRAVIFLAIVCAVLASLSASAAEPSRILSNSDDWKDVYSAMLYGSLTGRATSFIVSDRHATLILGQVPQGTHLWAISSKKVPFVIGYKNLLESRGYTAEEFVYENVNLELAKTLESVSSYVILDDSYGYNAISVAPYAVVTNSFVLFADRNNIRNIENFLNTKDVGKIIIYGNVDREVKSALEKYNPEIINKEGDRFLNNIEIVRKYQEIRHAKQAVLTNGEFIEQEIMSGTEPVVFICTNNVPDVIRDYVAGSDIQVGVLIGNELVSTATFIRRQMGISVFVKFAQGSRVPRGAISQVEALDMFYLPVYQIELEIASIKYNKATNKLEVALKNTKDQAAYAIGTYSLTASDSSRQTVGDIGANFIDGNEVKTFTYDVDSMPDGDISADVFVIYGESKGSLEKEIRKTMAVQTVRVLDECDVKVNEVSFGTRNNNFYINVENTGSVDCYVDAEVVDVMIAGARSTFGSDNVVQLGSGSSRNLRIRVNEMEEEDLPDNEQVTVRVFYGEREDTLVKVIEGKFELLLQKIDYLFYTLIVVIILLIGLVIWKRRKKKSKAV